MWYGFSCMKLYTIEFQNKRCIFKQKIPYREIHSQTRERKKRVNPGMSQHFPLSANLQWNGWWWCLCINKYLLNGSPIILFGHKMSPVNAVISAFSFVSKSFYLAYLIFNSGNFATTSTKPGQNHTTHYFLYTFCLPYFLLTLLIILVFITLPTKWWWENIKHTH